jgi:TetR/AcrR family transcriptional regulator, repressor of fatR-cypB operon
MNDPALPFYIQPNDPPARQEILRAALRLFSEHGLAGTSVRDIADESGYTNPALYKHFASKEELALHLFETCHRSVWARCNAATVSGKSFGEKLGRYVGVWLELLDEQPEVVAFLSDSARELMPKASSTVQHQTMIGLARSLMLEAPRSRRGASAVDPDLTAACLQGTLVEVGRMLQVGALSRPAVRWKGDLVALFMRIGA